MLTVDFDKLRLTQNMRVLDLGAGFGRHVFAARKHAAQVVALDMGMEELRETQATLQAMSQSGELETTDHTMCVQANGLTLPFSSASFDRIIASEVLEHVPDDFTVLQELYRVLKPGGCLAATVPSAIPEQICWWLTDAYHAPKAEGGHVRIYSKAELRTKMEATGFICYDQHRTHALHSPYWWLKCAVGLENESNFFVKKYLQFLTWDITKNPTLTQKMEKFLSPFLGKSFVLYVRKPPEV